jgi:hypothetical protein
MKNRSYILNRISVERGIITLLALFFLLLLRVVLRQHVVLDRPGVPTSVLAAEVEGHEDGEDRRHGNCGRECDVTGDEPNLN